MAEMGTQNAPFCVNIIAVVPCEASIEAPTLISGSRNDVTHMVFGSPPKLPMRVAAIVSMPAPITCLRTLWTSVIGLSSLQNVEDAPLSNQHGY